jgi:uncharacterized protein YecT (DUF1311 family)
MRHHLAALALCAIVQGAIAGATPNCDMDKGAIDVACDCSKSKNELELSFCLAAKRDANEKQLNDSYSVLMRRLSPAGKTRLRDAQRAWIKFRDAECLYAVGGPPSIQGRAQNSWNSAHAQCVAEVTAHRLDQLKTHLACTYNGCPE